MENTFPCEPATIAKAFSAHIHTGAFSLKNPDAASVLEFLYIAYTDVQGRDPKEIEKGFISLEDYLKDMTLEKNNEVFSIECGLCNAYEKRAFMDAIQTGAHLMLELQSK